MTKNSTAFTTPEPITATLTTGGARVRVVASERSDTVVRVEPIDSASKSDLKVAERTEVDYSAGELSVKTTKSGDEADSVAITLELPAGSKLVLNTAWTDVHASGPLGDCELNVTSGQVQLDHVAALRGNLADARVRVGHASSDVELAGASGSLDIDRAEGNVIAKVAGCPIRIGRLTGGQAELTNASGGIDIGISEGTTAWVDAKSTKGSVHNSLPTQDNESGNQVKVHARTRLDDIVIHRATV